MKLTDRYIPCDGVDMPWVGLSWAGFHTNNEDMCEAGWQLKVLYNRFTKKYRIRFYHPTLFMTFSLKCESISDLDGKTFDIEFMSLGGKRNRRPLNRDIKTLSIDDVPLLLETVVELQKPIRKKQIKAMSLPKAEVFDITEYMNVQ